MFLLLIFNCFVLCVGIFDVGAVSAVDYGPSLSSLTSIYGRKNGHYESNRANKIFLEHYPRFSTIIPLITSSAIAYSDEIFQERGTPRVGRFTVEAPKNHGIIAVIQQLELPLEISDSDSDSSDPDCKDFIQFGEVGGYRTSEICGKLDKGNKALEPKGLVGSRIFVSSKGKLIVLFKHGELSDYLIYTHERLIKKDKLQINRDQIYRVEIALTAFKECPQQDESSNGNTTEMENDYLVCSNSTHSNENNCIHSDLFCDQMINCGFPSDFGADEKYCEEQTFFSRSIGEDDVTKPEITPEITNQLPYYRTQWADNSYDLIVKASDDSGTTEVEKEDPPFDLVELHLTPASTILLIGLTIAFVMVAGVTLRFCCTKCVGKAPPTEGMDNAASEPPRYNTGVPYIVSLSQRQRQQRGTVATAAQNTNFTDTPPSYEDLFPVLVPKEETSAVSSNSASLPVDAAQSGTEDQNQWVNSVKTVPKY